MELTNIILLTFSQILAMEPPVISNDVVQKCEVVSEGDVGLTAVNLHAWLLYVKMWTPICFMQ